MQLGKTPTFPVGQGGRLLSVWDWQRLDYAYYVDPNGSLDPGGWVWRPPPRTGFPATSPIGEPVEMLLRELPATARFVGRGQDARGEVVVLDRARFLHVAAPLDARSGLRGFGQAESPPGGLLDVLLWGGLVVGVGVVAVKVKQALE